jgi:hypothetical protein
MTPNDVDRWLEQTLRAPAPAPSADLLARVLAIPSQTVIAPEDSLSLGALFSAWQKAFMGGAVFASLVAGIIVGGAPTQTTAVSDWPSEDVPGLTYSPGDGGDW